MLQTFCGNKPTDENQHPSLHLGYNPTITQQLTVVVKLSMRKAVIMMWMEILKLKRNTLLKKTVQWNLWIVTIKYYQSLLFFVLKSINNVFAVMVAIASLLCFGWVLRSKYRQVNAGLKKTKLALKRYKMKFNVVREKNKLLIEKCVCNLPMHQRLLKKPNDCLY